MPIARFQMPDGRVARFEVPEGTTPEQAQELMASQMASMGQQSDATPAEPSLMSEVGRGLKKAGQGFALGVSDIGNTVLNAAAYLPGKATDAIRGALPADRRKLVPDIAQMTRTRNADFDAITDQNKDSMAFGAGRLGGNIAATLPVGGALAGVGRAAAPALAATKTGSALLNAVSSGGMTTGAPAAAGLRAALGNLGTRAAGGAINGGVSAGLVNPEDAGLGAAIGGALPVVTKAAGLAGRKTGGALRGKPLGDEVRALATRAQELGIDIPVDRLANSKPLNAVASSLNYVPFSGRAGTEAKMQSQLNRALSRTFGQDSDNVTQALRKANGDLGGEFDRVLRSNTVKIDSQFLDELAEAEQTAARELGTDGAGVISRQIDEIMNKGASGQIDGQTAYNIKKMLDRIGKRNTPEAYYAGDLRRSLMGALDRSMTPDAAKAFATTRKQYGNMLTLEKLAQNGGEGDISIARIANMKNIGNADLQELADISAQFLKPREGAHGSMQRAVAALGVGGTLGLPALAGGAVAARGVNSVMNSRTAREMMLNGGAKGLSPEMLEILYRTAPVVGSR